MSDPHAAGSRAAEFSCGVAHDRCLTFTIQPAGTSGQVSVMVQLVPFPATSSSYDKTWDFQCAIKGMIDPMMARHIGQRLIDQAGLAEATARDA